ncbi:50S ribosomal protein L4 [Alphaproteobacteria bacterium endosymbiont of Tiliacea citrago]|uniref:50S ribosomal protein L4 n=1 Tax=Alphaproteobacteria bacterium endosymbiont of Tiliacea citrago TaxID=3077944 RepID=UPI00313D89CA
MKISVKKWDFTETGDCIDIPNFVPNFGVVTFQDVSIQPEAINVKKKLSDSDEESSEGLSLAEETSFASDLREYVFSDEFLEMRSKDIISQVIRWQLAKKRSGNASTKTRSDVSGTTRKPWAQKESGRARQGSLRGPHFRGGGVVFGPHPRSYEHNLNKKFKKLALGLTLNQKIKEGSLIVLDSFSSDVVKTKDFESWRKNNDLNSVLFVGDTSDNLKRSFSNIYNVNCLPLIGLNVLSCVKHEAVIFDLNAINGVLNRFSSSVLKGGENA